MRSNSVWQPVSRLLGQLGGFFSRDRVEIDSVREVSFKGALQTITNLLPLLSTRIATESWCNALIEAIATHVVGNRPDRFEPRVRKHRPESYKLMREPREHYKKRMAA